MMETIKALLEKNARMLKASKISLELEMQRKESRGKVSQYWLQQLENVDAIIFLASKNNLWVMVRKIQVTV